MTKGEKVLMERTLLSAADNWEEVEDVYILEIWVRRLALLEQCNLNDKKQFMKIFQGIQGVTLEFVFTCISILTNYHTVLGEMSMKLNFCHK